MVIEGIKKMYSETKHIQEMTKAQRLTDSLLSFHPQAYEALQKARREQTEKIIMASSTTPNRAYKPIDYKLIGQPGYNPAGNRSIRKVDYADSDDNKANKTISQDELNVSEQILKALNAKEPDELLEAFENNTSAIKSFMNKYARTNIKNASPIGIFKLWKQNIDQIKEGIQREQLVK